jgi:diguanylate cyclase (GGDEF)-like protein
VNDQYGHSCGDEALRHLAKLLRSALRETDIAGRYGGEEFVVTLLDTDKKGTAIFAERLRVLIESRPVVYKNLEIKMTISIGTACFSHDFKDHERWIEAADKALYHSKDNGRNKVTDFDGLNDA